MTTESTNQSYKSNYIDESRSLKSDFFDSGLEFKVGILSIDLKTDRFDLITPEGERIRLNPRLNRGVLTHLHQQAVRVLLRRSAWPKLQSCKTFHDVLFVERLSDPPELDTLEDILTGSTWNEDTHPENRSVVYAS